MKLSIVLFYKNYRKTASPSHLVSRLSIILFFLGMSFISLRAAHIIGGEITYECLGWTNGDPSTNSRSYQFYLNIYRDCQGGGADFDSAPFGSFDATVSIYRADSTDEYLNIVLGAPTVTLIDPDPNNPCVIVPTNVCVEQGVYTFPIIDLPVSDQSYFITYQRCCRNNTITNIYQPGDSGASYFMELTPAAQQGCNNSPVFNDFPPVVICSGESFVFDHSATDADGDQLVYEFCAPFLGGGTNFGDPEAVDGLAPNPEAPPPYDEVNFVAPQYSALDPLGTNADINIDVNTGIITGLPLALGQFVVGVCVNEYRNGELISVVRRDFQFNVTNCTPTVVANINENNMIHTMDYHVTSCGDPSIFIVNQSYQQSFIDEQFWVFDLGDRDTILNTWNASITFPGPGRYDGQLILNPNTECGDTANIIIDIYPELVADFEYDYDTCVAGPVDFFDQSVVEGGTIANWNWDFGNGYGSSNVDPSYLYEEAGNRLVELKITDEFGCQDSVLKLIKYFPVPALIIVSPSSFEGCVPGEIGFTNLSNPINDDYDILWDFGDGNTSNEFSPSHVFNEPGEFSIALDITSPIGCQTDTVFKDLIFIEPAPVADFDYSPEVLDNFNPVVQLTDQSTGAVRWYYDFEGAAYSTDPNPTYEFRDTGLQAVTLIVTHESGCIDSITQYIDVVPEVTFYMPNAFTPNDDSINDLFKGKGYLNGYKQFDLSIWNRWGEAIFHTTDPEEGWNGLKDNTGPPIPEGVYFYLLQYTNPRGQQIEMQGTATLIR